MSIFKTDADADPPKLDNDLSRQGEGLYDKRPGLNDLKIFGRSAPKTTDHVLTKFLKP